MNYHLLSQSVPTLSATMLILLSLLLFIVAFKISKKAGNNAGKMFITLIGISAIISGIGGVKLITDAQALITEYPLTVGADGKGHVNRKPFDTTHSNPNSTTVVIDSIESCSISEGKPKGNQSKLAAAPAPVPICVTGSQVAPGESCRLLGCDK